MCCESKLARIFIYFTLPSSGCCLLLPMEPKCKFELLGDDHSRMSFAGWFVKVSNRKNYNFLDCDWFRKLLSDRLLSDSSINQSHSKL